MLDHRLKSGTENKTKQTLVNWTPIFILWLGIAYYLKNGITNDVQVTAAIILLLISTITTYGRYELGTKITFGSIVLGVLNLVTYFPISYSIGCGVGDFGVSIEVIMIVIGIIHYFANREVMSKFLGAIMNSDISEDKIKAQERNKINAFKNQFKKKNIEELNKLMNNENLVHEAIKAASELVSERNIEDNIKS